MTYSGCAIFGARGLQFMGDFNRKVEDTTTRVGKSVGETTERLEKEASDFIKYLNNEVVTAVRQHSKPIAIKSRYKSKPESPVGTGLHITTGAAQMAKFTT